MSEVSKAPHNKGKNRIKATHPYTTAIGCKKNHWPRMRGAGCYHCGNSCTLSAPCKKSQGKAECFCLYCVGKKRLKNKN